MAGDEWHDSLPHRLAGIYPIAQARRVERTIHDHARTGEGLSWYRWDPRTSVFDRKVDFSF